MQYVLVVDGKANAAAENRRYAELKPERTNFYDDELLFVIHLSLCEAISNEMRGRSGRNEKN